MAPEPPPAPPAPPRDPLAMPAEKHEQIVQKLSATVPSIWKCPVCPTGLFGLANHFVSPTTLSQDGSVNLGGTVYPSILLICGTCGHTRLHNAVILGVFR